MTRKAPAPIEPDLDELIDDFKEAREEVVRAAAGVRSARAALAVSKERLEEQRKALAEVLGNRDFKIPRDE